MLPTEFKNRTLIYPLRSIYFYLSAGCNLRCQHCWINPKYQTPDRPQPSLGVGLFRSIINQAKPLGLSSVKLTGGEPLLHPRIHGILSIIREEDLRLVVETNGVLCTPELAKDMAACKDTLVSVSLDGANSGTHDKIRGVKGSFDEACRGIRNLVKVGIKPQIIMTIMRQNKNQMEDVVRLAESLGASSVKFNILQPTARGERLHQLGQNLSIEELVELGRWAENELSSNTDLRISYSHPLAFRALSNLYGDDKDSGCLTCGIFRIIGVLANGSYALCGIGQTVPDLIFGHASKDSLEDVWNNTPVLKQIRQGLPNRLEGICSDCIMSAICLGSCIAQNYYTSRDLFAANWYCEETYDKGLFPMTRLYKKVNAEWALSQDWNNS